MKGSNFPRTFNFSRKEIAQAEGQIAQLALQTEEHNKGVSLHRQEIETLENSLKRSASEIQEAARDRTLVDNDLQEAKLNQTEVRTRLEELEREAREKFGLAIEDLSKEILARETAAQNQAGGPGGLDWEGGAEEGGAGEGAEAAATSAAISPASADFQAAPTTPTSPAPSPPPSAAPSAAAPGGPEDLTNLDVLRRLLNEVREKLARLGNVNTTAIEEYEEKRKRFEFLSTQKKDLEDAKKSLDEAITSLDATCTKLFAETFEKVRGHFVETFRRLFNGGRSDLVLQAPEMGVDQLETGIDILAQPPGKKLQSISLMSGGEKALTAVALMFALFLHKPSPFCVLDEIDAPLDDVNVGRFCDLVREFAKNTQFIIITHNKITMSLADTIYGVTMQEPGVSKIVSVKFEEATADRLLTGGAAG